MLKRVLVILLFYVEMTKQALTIYDAATCVNCLDGIERYTDSEGTS